MVLEKIQKENDIKKLTPEELELLKDEIRHRYDFASGKYKNGGAYVLMLS